MLSATQSSQSAASVCGYELFGTLGQGSQGKVKLGRNPTTGLTVAIKITQKRPDLLAAVAREIKIHAQLHHENIIEVLDGAEDDRCSYIVMEYASAGELFDRIGGFPSQDYMHERGVSHRDLKPENILLDGSGNLKISDFGLATVFRRHDGATRVLTTPCGSPPYVAPEIHRMEYKGDAVDIWSAGIILYVLLAGNTPWAEPTPHDEEFKFFLTQYPALNYPPWNGFSPSVLNLLRGILNVDPESRYSIAVIASNEWFRRENPLLTDGRCNDPALLAERMMSRVEDDMMDIASQGQAPAFVSFSQPVGGGRASQGSSLRANSQTTRGFGALFPAERLTRFYTLARPNEIFQTLAAVFESFLVPYKVHSKMFKIGFTTVDKRKCPLHGEVLVQPVSEGMYIVRFSKSKGDPIEFKRLYKALMEKCGDLVVREPERFCVG
ncbi:kinase-like domain-containing protein [Blyttiomyces helicus]|uniref:non-specific serine/threonine protein kinase n=1 Tax=Blyttiomyces helicus TaxID=388810 RepID=A0A4P9WJ55_9FUNG|nr:kinase-like domain-containing protein [Blyttiomyces helicus]|eukprot:RKO91508.1 kinase-like domain-containing protein [Blyttiomyces helicus]